MISQFIFLLIFLTIIITLAVFYLRSVQKLLNAISAEFRYMPASQVGLMLIPLFNIVFHFVMVFRIADSVRDQILKLGVPTGSSKPGLIMGISTMALYLAGVVLNTLGWELTIDFLCTIGSLICWIIYWVQIERYRKLITTNQHHFLIDAE